MRLYEWICNNISPSLDLFGTPSSRAVLFQTIAMYLPSRIRSYIATNGKSPRIVRAKAHQKLALDTARELVQMKSEELLAGDSQKDVMSLIGMHRLQAIVGDAER
jgi:hypothetical protein